MSLKRMVGMMVLLAACDTETGDGGEGCPVPRPPDASAPAVNVVEDAGAEVDAADAAPRICPIPAGRIVAVGDSITAGTSPEDPNYPGQLAVILGRPVENLGRGRAVAMNPTSDPTNPSLADLTGTPGTALLRIGFNDLRLLKRTSAQVIADVDAYVARQEAKGWRVIVQPIWRADPFVSLDLARQRVNAHLAKYGAPSIALDTRMGDLSDPGDKACLFDGIHPTPLCHKHQAEYAVRALQTCP